MHTLTAQIEEILDEQAGHYQTLRRILVRQAARLREDDVVGVGTATVEIRGAMGQIGELEARLTPLIAQWQERPSERDVRIQDAAEALCALVAELQDLRAQNEELAKTAMDRRRREMMALSAGANAVRGYSPRPSEEARFVDKKR